VLQVHDSQGQVQTFALDDTSTLRLPPGGYELFLKNPRSRQLTPGKLKLGIHDRTTVQIEAPSAGPHAPIKMVAIAAGSFVMGAAEGDPQAGQNELPRRKVTIEKPFQISAHEITVGQFREFVEATSRRPSLLAKAAGSPTRTRAGGVRIRRPSGRTQAIHLGKSSR
jgi:formylglycine-generating enzyme required for sulfatase activity